MRSLNTRGHASKQVSNLPILKINHKLNSIEDNKGRMYEELRYIFMYSLKFDQIEQ